MSKIFSKKFGKNFTKINASNIFLKNLKNVSDPEKKRKIIGKTFIEVFDKAAKKISNVDYLGQGTLYPDIIEVFHFLVVQQLKSKVIIMLGGLPKK